MKRLILPLILLPFINYGQWTAIPDQNFEQALISLGYDNVIDGQVITANISNVSQLDVSSKSISDLTGIEDFTALEDLVCSYNQITSLDVSQNTALTELWYSYSYQLTCLNVKNGNNTNFSIFHAVNNPNLTCIEVDDSTYSTQNWTFIDAGVTFSTNCNYPSNCFSTTVITEQTNSINLYPNPTNNLITLDIEGYNGTVNVEVYDLTGKLLQTTTNTIISMGEYAKGIYVFKVAYGDVVERLKVVKE